MKNTAPVTVFLGLYLTCSHLTCNRAFAETLDVSRPFICASTKVLECLDNSACSQVSPDSIDAPAFMRINIKTKEVYKTDNDVSSKIKLVEEVENRLVLQGIEDGRPEEGDGVGWVISVEKSTGHMVATAAGIRAAFVIFGSCTAL